MADRPYVSYLTRDLEREFEANLNNKKILTELKKELSFRSRPKALKLKERVERRLAELKQGKHAIEQASLLDYSPKNQEEEQGELIAIKANGCTNKSETPTTHDDEKKYVDRQPSLFEKIVHQCKKLFGE